jgi:hypothetical protein
MACDRILKDHRLYSSGDRIKLERMVDRMVAQNYVVKIKENIFVEEDPTKKCKNYPNSEYSSYRDCDHHWMKSTIEREAPGLVPVWLGDNLELVTKQYSASAYSDTTAVTLMNLYDGTFVSDCPLPCTTIYTETRLISQADYDDESEEENKIDFTFSPKVLVTTTDFVKPTLSMFLSDVGGSLGLWLGLGAVQTIEMVINFVLPRLRW